MMWGRSDEAERRKGVGWERGSDAAKPRRSYTIGLTQKAFFSLRQSGTFFFGWCFLPASLAKNTNQRK